MKPHIEVARSLWLQHVKPKARVIDATVGNGHDTLFLAHLLNGEGELIGYEIQDQALQNTEMRLASLSKNLRQVIRLKRQSHVHFDEKNVDLIVYNLGYLPGGDKSLTTQSATTLKSIQHALEIISEKGAISITFYPGHPEGEVEKNTTLQYLKVLPIDKWRISHFRWLNNLSFGLSSSDSEGFASQIGAISGETQGKVPLIKPRSPSLVWIEPL